MRARARMAPHGDAHSLRPERLDKRPSRRQKIHPNSIALVRPTVVAPLIVPLHSHPFPAEPPSPRLIPALLSHPHYCTALHCIGRPVVRIRSARRDISTDDCCASYGIVITTITVRHSLQHMMDELLLVRAGGVDWSARLFVREWRVKRGDHCEISCRHGAVTAVSVRSVSATRMQTWLHASSLAAQ